VIRTAVLHLPLPEGQLTLGYVRADPGHDALVHQGSARLHHWARSTKLMLGAIFTDVTTAPPLQRPGFRRLQSTVHRLRPVGLITPDARHISDDHDELARVLGHLRSQRCLLLVVDAQTTPGAASSTSSTGGS
jgi:hypothetical protein